MSDDFDMRLTERLVMIPGPRRSWYAQCPEHSWTSADERSTRGEAVIDYSRHLRDFHAPRRKDGSA